MTVRQGFIASYNPSRGFGFIVPDDVPAGKSKVPASSSTVSAGKSRDVSSKKVLFRYDVVAPGMLGPLFEGQKVKFKVAPRSREDMWPVASSVEPLEYNEADWDEPDAWSSSS